MYCWFKKKFGYLLKNYQKTVNIDDCLHGLRLTMGSFLRKSYQISMIGLIGLNVVCAFPGGYQKFYFELMFMYAKYDSSKIRFESAELFPLKTYTKG